MEFDINRKVPYMDLNNEFDRVSSAVEPGSYTSNIHEAQPDPNLPCGRQRSSTYSSPYDLQRVAPSADGSIFNLQSRYSWKSKKT